jgi:hypothetical protein
MIVATRVKERTIKSNTKAVPNWTDKGIPGTWVEITKR